MAFISDQSKIYLYLWYKNVPDVAVALWCSGYHYFITWFKPCSWRVGDSGWWGSLTMVPAGNKTKTPFVGHPYHKNKNNSWNQIENNQISNSMLVASIKRFHSQCPHITFGKNAGWIVLIKVAIKCAFLPSNWFHRTDLLQCFLWNSENKTFTACCNARYYQKENISKYLKNCLRKQSKLMLI